jgi:hypothetical protein
MFLLKIFESIRSKLSKEPKSLPKESRLPTNTGDICLLSKKPMNLTRPSPGILNVMGSIDSSLFGETVKYISKSLMVELK